MRLRLRHMEVLEAVLHGGSTLAAAECLHVSQPVVSRTLKHAEQRLGYALFRRRSGRLEPTPEARALLPELEAFFSHWRKIQQYAENLADRESVLRVAVTPALAGVLPLAVMQVHETMPGVRFSLLTLHTDEIVNQLLSGRIDIGIGQGRETPSGVGVETLGQGRLVMLVPRAWGIGQYVDATRLVGRPFIGIEKSSGLAEIVETYLHQQELKLEHVAEVQTYGLAAALAEQGLGATVVDRFTAETANDVLVQRLPLTEAPTSPIQRFSHPRHVPGEAETAFVAVVRAMLTDE